jgi:hypothetical protein
VKLGTYNSEPQATNQELRICPSKHLEMLVLILDTSVFMINLKKKNPQRFTAESMDIWHEL